MAFQLLYDATNKVLMARFTGIATDRDVSAMTEAARRFVQRNGACSAIADFSPVESFAVTVEFIRELAKASPIMAGHRRMLVGPSDTIFGSLRMFELQQARDGDHATVVRSLARAYEVLGIANPDFQPVAIL